MFAHAQCAQNPYCVARLGHFPHSVTSLVTLICPCSFNLDFFCVPCFCVRKRGATSQRFSLGAVVRRILAESTEM